MPGLRRGLGRSVMTSFVLMMTMAGSAGIVAAQETTTVSLSINASPPWTNEVSQDVVPDLAPGMLLTDEERFVLVLGDEFPVTDQQRHDALEELGAEPQSIVTLDQGDSGTVAYWLDVATVENESWGAFTLVLGGDNGTEVFTMYFGPVDGFAAGLTSAQEAITVNGAPLLDGVEGGGLQDLLESAPQAMASPEAATEDDDGRSDKLDGPREGDRPDGTWLDEEFAYRVAWHGDWEQMGRNENTLVLISPDGSLFLNLTAQPSNGATTADLELNLTAAFSDLGLELGPSGTYRDDDNVILAGSMEGMPFIQEVILIAGGDVAVFVTVGLVEGADAEEAISNYRASVVIANVEPLDGWEEIEFDA